MRKKQFNENLVPLGSVIMGTRSDGQPHRFVVGNEEGEILPSVRYGAPASPAHHLIARELKPGPSGLSS
jgi:hypothetical protein